MASPPVVKFLDFGQYKYELTKREKEAKRKQRSVTFKEVRLSPKIGSGDFDTKVNRAIEFFEDGDRIKVTVRFRGRELTHPELGRALIARFADRVKDHGVPERTPLLEGKSMHITMASTHKPKSHDAPVQRSLDGGNGADATSVAATSRGERSAGRRSGGSRSGGGCSSGGCRARSEGSTRTEDSARTQDRTGTETSITSETGSGAGADWRVSPECPRSRATRPRRSGSASPAREVLPRQRLEWPPPRDQVVPSDPPLPRQVADRARAREAGPSPAAVPLGADRPMARVKRGVTAHRRHKRLSLTTPRAARAPSRG